MSPYPQPFRFVPFCFFWTLCLFVCQAKKFRLQGCCIVCRPSHGFFISYPVPFLPAHMHTHSFLSKQCRIPIFFFCLRRNGFLPIVVATKDTTFTYILLISPFYGSLYYFLTTFSFGLFHSSLNPPLGGVSVGILISLGKLPTPFLSVAILNSRSSHFFNSSQASRILLYCLSSSNSLSAFCLCLKSSQACWIVQ